MAGFPIAPFNYLLARAARSYITGPDTPAPAPVPNPRANPAYAAQVFSPEYIDRMIKAQVTGQPVMLPEVVVTAPRINNQPAPAYDTNTL